MVTGSVYCLRNPLNDDAIFYVGQTVLKLKDRLQSHIRESRFRKNAKGMVIKNILDAKKMPLIESLEDFTGETYSEFSALMTNREMYWIGRFENLCNKSHAGYELICDNCLNKFTAKRLRAKFCSDICRASFHQNNPKKEIKKELTSKDMYDKMIELISEMNKRLTTQIENASFPPMGYSQDGTKGIIAAVENDNGCLKSEFDFLNQISGCQYEAEYITTAAEIKAATHLAQRVRDRLILNMNQNKMQ